MLSSLVREGANLEVIEDKAVRLLHRTRLNMLRNTKTGPNEFTKLIEIKQKYDERKDKFLIYSLNSRSMNSEPTYVFSSNETAIEIGRQIDRDKNSYLTQHMPTLMEDDIIIPVHILPTSQQANFISESENKKNSETFWNLWNEAFSSRLEERYMYNPARLMHKEKGWNWNAIKIVFGCELMERYISCKFHIKQRINRKMKDSMFTNSEDREKFRNLTRNMSEAQTEIRFKTALTNLESFITEKKELNLLSEWLKW